MTTVPGTNFTKEQLEAAIRFDNVSVGGYSGSDRMKQIGFEYHTEKKQYDKALAWYLLAAKENNSHAQNCIGVLYYDGEAVPKNYLCALKWHLKAAEQNYDGSTPNNIGKFFEYGQCVPLDKYKALEWYCRGGDKTSRDRLKSEGYHRSDIDKRKRHTQLIKETEAVLDAEKKKLEEKQNKTQEEMEALVDVEITYKLVDGGKEAWNVVPILLANDRQRYMKPVKKQIQPLKQDKNTFESQAKQLESLKQEKTNLELQIKEKDKELVSLINDKESLQQGSSSVQHQTKDSKMNSLQVENQELKLKIISLQNENQSLKHRVDKYEQQLKSKDNTTQLLESDGEDINYDTPSEDEDNNNDLNYDDTNESNK